MDDISYAHIPLTCKCRVAFGWYKLIQLWWHEVFIESEAFELNNSVLSTLENLILKYPYTFQRIKFTVLILGQPCE